MAEIVPGSAAALRALLRVGASTTLVVLSFAMLVPVLAVRLQQSGASSWAIGVFAMLPYLCVGLMIPLMPRLFGWLGVARAYRWGLALQLMATAGYALTDTYALWCVLAALGGVGSAAAWNGTEAMIAHNAPAERRGRLTGLYQTALGGALALGPFLPGLLPLSPAHLTGLATACLAVALALTFSAGVGRLAASRPGMRHWGLLDALRRVPGLAWVALAGGVFEAGLGAVTSAHGAHTGLSLSLAASVAGALGMGSFLLQYPSGWLADHLPAQRIFAMAGVLLALSSLAFFAAEQWSALLWICAFVWGAVGGALYTLTMIRVAHEFADSSALAGAAAMISAYTAGGALGPALSGWVLDVGGVAGQGLWLMLLALSVVAVARGMGRSPPSEARS